MILVPFSEKSSKTSSGVGRSKSLKGAVSTYLLTRRKTDENITKFEDAVSATMKSQYKTQRLPENSQTKPT